MSNKVIIFPSPDMDETMTKAELLELLEDYPPDTPIAAIYDPENKAVALLVRGKTTPKHH